MANQSMDRAMDQVPNQKSDQKPEQKLDYKSSQRSDQTSDESQQTQRSSLAAHQLQPDIHEGSATRMIENQTARIPSVGYLTLAVSSMLISATIGIRGGNQRGWVANFVGQWAPCFLLLGIYNKIVKLESEFARSQMH